MITWKHGIIAPPILLTLLLSACGGGSDSTATLTTPENQTPDTGAAVGGETDQSTPPTTTAISGRVADGYIRGAKVCIDLNDNEACDEDEPSTTTGEGGVYTLLQASDAEDKAIIADIPADAIDEDTGEAVGAKLLFTAPAGRPEFLSPITTLIQQELKNNPALDVDEAEASVKTILGIDDSTAVSLFKDYVAEADLQANDAESSGKYEFLHDTARVIASMMKDIEAQVENAATEQGLDVEGNKDTSRAIRELVRNEVRELLPDIARTVASFINSAAATEENADETANATPIDADQIALDLRPSDATDRVDERIQAISDQGSIVKAEMKQLLSDGIYILDLDCHNYEESKLDATAQFEDEGFAAVPSCDVYYDHIHLNESGDEVINESYHFDHAANDWVELTDDGDKGEADKDYSLVNGEWLMQGSEADSQAVSFTEDGAAIVSEAFGDLHVRAVSQVLDGLPLQHHFWETGAQPAWFRIAGPDAVFASQSDHYRLSLRQGNAPFLLFNFPSYSEEDNCLEYNGNCNVVKAVGTDTFNAQTTLAEIQEATLDKIELIGINPIARRVSLSAAAPEDGSLPIKGIVNWKVNFGFDIEPGENAGGDADADPEFEPGNETTDQALLDEGISPDGSCVGEGEHLAESDLNGADPGVSATPLPSLPNFQLPDSQVPVEEAAFTEGDAQIEPAMEYPCKQEPPRPDYSTNADTLLTSKWRLLSVDGVDMIEIQMPLLLRHGDEQNSEESMLLIEQNGFVRLGARFADISIEAQTSYNLSAFETLSAIIKGAFAQN